MTQAQFDDYPLRLRASHMREILDLSDEGLTTWREQHPETVLETYNEGRAKRYVFSKPKVAAALGLEYK